MTPENNLTGQDIARRHIEHFVADLDETPLQATDKVKEDSAPSSLWGEAWKNLRKQPLFINSTA